MQSVEDPPRSKSATEALTQVRYLKRALHMRDLVAVEVDCDVSCGPGVRVLPELADRGSDVLYNTTLSVLRHKKSVGSSLNSDCFVDC